jgi:N-methylhydantoinase B
VGLNPLTPDAVPDPIEVRITAGALASACEEMGAILVRSAHSANIKERRDCSAAVFNAAGEMAMQAEHIPVHLGSMPSSVAAVIDREHRPGFSWFLNDPFTGGTHLPDITVVTPAFSENGELIGFAANRAHHADVGGRLPGSMPADSRTLDEEGVVISPRVLDEAAIDEVVAQMRQPEQRRADLRAQLAANAAGVNRLVELATARGTEGLAAAMNSVLTYAEARTRARIAEIEDGEYTACDQLEAIDGDLKLKLKATVAGDRITFDFTGSSGQDRGNLNCPLSVTASACFFAVRVITDPDIPASAGAYRPIEVIVPPGTLLNAAAPAAVVAGNVETSSRVADLCLRAFGRALGQGTMNNFTLGNEGFTYYETLGGGQAAGPDADGPSAVHVAMSNTLNTPIEALEIEFPMRATEYSIRRGSGGSGKHRGGDGLVREIEALEPMEFALLTERRRHRPPGAEGGGKGAAGENLLLPAGEARPERLEPKATGRLKAGDRLRIETPGGGGYGGA